MAALRWIGALILLTLAMFYCADDDEDPEEHRERLYVAAFWYRNTLCTERTSGNALRDGVCLDAAECSLTRGTRLGSCGVIGSCCAVERTCSNSTRYKVSYFQYQSLGVSECNYRVDVISRDVCQMRLDFEVFTLAPPTSVRTSSLRKEAYFCTNDSFTVSPAPANLGFTSLCGENSGQHIYVPVNASAGTTSLTLIFNLANRTNTLLAAPNWRIKVTQLECASTLYDYSTVHSTLATIGQQHHRKKSQATNDFYRLAPPGCLQYFTERSGTYRSFNFISSNPNASRYIGNLNYAICFRRYENVCGVQHSANFFQLDFNDIAVTTGIAGDRLCDQEYYIATAAVGLTDVSNDYLFIPNGVLSNTTILNKFCDATLNSGNTVTSYNPGPLYVYFHSDATDNAVTHANTEVGFSINYQLVTTGCDNSAYIHILP